MTALGTERYCNPANRCPLCQGKDGPHRSNPADTPLKAAEAHPGPAEPAPVGWVLQASTAANRGFRRPPPVQPTWPRYQPLPALLCHVVDGEMATRLAATPRTPLPVRRRPSRTRSPLGAPRPLRVIETHVRVRRPSMTLSMVTQPVSTTGRARSQNGPLDQGDCWERLDHAAGRLGRRVAYQCSRCRQQMLRSSGSPAHGEALTEGVRHPMA